MIPRHILQATYALLLLFFFSAFSTYVRMMTIQSMPIRQAKKLLSSFNKVKTAPYIHAGEGADYYTERDGKKLVICFQGSHGKEDWLHNFDFFAKPYKDMTATWRVHRGFLKVWKAVEDIIGEEIADPGIDTIHIIGYSHGGALAQFCHEYCMYHRPDCYIRTYAFGAPRIVFGIIPAEVKRRFRGLYIIINGLDIVPHLPFLFFGFRHVGKKIDVGMEIHPTRSHLRYREVIEAIINRE